MQAMLDFDAPAQRHSPTSCAAAEAIAPHVQPAEARVLEWVRSCGAAGSTDNEGIAAGVCSINGYRARRVSLWRKGLIVQRGERDGSVVWCAKGATDG
jgi:hypothetical protein